MGSDAMQKDIGEAARDLEKNLDNMSLGDDDSDEELDAPVFTHELAKMKAEAMGDTFQEEDEEMDDEEKKDNYPEAFSDSDEENEDFTIRKTDSIIVTATAENDHSNLEVYIYEHEKGNLYVHHEIILAAYPLCLEWLPFWQGEKANLIVVGTFLP
jgi:periodic tryptophan protein 1